MHRHTRTHHFFALFFRIVIFFLIYQSNFIFHVSFYFCVLYKYVCPSLKKTNLCSFSLSNVWMCMAREKKTFASLFIYFNSLNFHIAWIVGIITFMLFFHCDHTRNMKYNGNEYLSGGSFWNGMFICRRLVVVIIVRVDRRFYMRCSTSHCLTTTTTPTMKNKTTTNIIELTPIFWHWNCCCCHFSRSPFLFSHWARNLIKILTSIYH